MKQLARILVPLDRAPGLEAIVEYACAVARGVAAAITFIHVDDVPNAMIAIVPGASVEGDEVIEARVATVMLDRAVALAGANGIPDADRILEREPSPSHAIVRHARAGRFDLIVMGTHARSAVPQLLLGSVAMDVLRAAPCPVLMVHLPRD